MKKILPLIFLLIMIIIPIVAIAEWDEDDLPDEKVPNLHNMRLEDSFVEHFKAAQNCSKAVSANQKDQLFHSHVQLFSNDNDVYKFEVKKSGSQCSVKIGNDSRSFICMFPADIAKQYGEAGYRVVKNIYPERNQRVIDEIYSNQNYCKRQSFKLIKKAENNRSLKEEREYFNQLKTCHVDFYNSAQRITVNDFNDFHYGARKFNAYAVFYKTPSKDNTKSFQSCSIKEKYANGDSVSCNLSYDVAQQYANEGLKQVEYIETLNNNREKKLVDKGNYIKETFTTKAKTFTKSASMAQILKNNCQPIPQEAMNQLKEFSERSKRAEYAEKINKE